MLTVIIIAKNEEANIERCLSSIKWADEIIVLDSGSTDQTISIAKRYTKHVYSTNWEGYGIQKQRALAYATGHWVLNLDADESVTDELRAQVVHVMKHGKYDAYRLPIRMCFYGKQLRFSASPSRHIRLFKREGAQYSDDIVHEKVVLPANARVSKLRGAIIHHSWQDLSHALYKLNRYSSYSAKTRLELNKKSSIVKAVTSAVWMFFRSFLLQRGFLDGREGFVLACLSAQGSFYRGVKQIYKDKYLSDIPAVRQQDVQELSNNAN